jgi:protein phosphatase
MSDDRNEEETVEIPVGADTFQPLGPQTGSAQLQVDLAAATHPGYVRSRNEDHYLVVRISRSLETLLTSLPGDQLPARSDEVGYALLVADGIGGAAAGERASRVAINTMVGLVLHTPDWVMSNETQEVQRIMDRLADRFQQIHATLGQQAVTDPNLAGMGTTMTLACNLGTSLVLGHIGDSRAYLLRGSRLVQLTRDHTLVQSMIDAGLLSEQQATTHPLQHVLTRSLGGGYSAGIQGDFQNMYLTDGDQLLLCTDGLTNMVDDAGVASILQSAPSSHAACQALVAAALQNGGKDNVTVALARYRFPQ